MNLSALPLPADPSQAYLLRRVLESTTPAEESETDATARCGTILETFDMFAPANALQAMIACHCITLDFVLSAAMRDACDIRLEPRLMLRARSGGQSISRGLHQWVSKFEKLKAKDEKRAAEAPPPDTTARAATPAPVPAAPPVRTKPRQPEQSPPKPASRSIQTPPLTIPSPASVPSFPVDFAAPPLGRNALAASASRIALLAPMASISTMISQAVRASLGS
jgi:hypothetical protein